MTYGLKRNLLLLPLLAPFSLFLLSACASHSQLDTAIAENQQLRTQNDQLQTQNQQLQQQASADQAHIDRLREAIKYTVNSDLLFPSGGWQMSDAGKDTIANMAKILAPQQEEKLLVTGYTDNTPVGAGLQAQGVTSNEILSQKRADNVMQYMISQGVKPELIAARGFGDTYPVAPNTSAQSRAQNRRVEITLAGPGS
jgi:chemotaxis protein MotB